MSHYLLEEGGGVLVLEPGGGDYLLDVAGRVLIALDDTPLEPDPVWTRIDDTDNLVAGIEIRRGKQTEQDVTETSTATVYVNDTDGLFDWNNTGSPYYGKINGQQIILQCWNPVAMGWVQQWQGFIDEVTFDFDPATDADGDMIVANVALECVDRFDKLARVGMIVGVFGEAPPPGSEGVVYYATASVQTRLEALLDDSGLDASQYVVFTGNVDVQPSKYDPGDSVLVALRDAADAEAPTIANLYTDKLGRVVFHGRFAQLDPEGTEASAAPGAWNFTRWKAGDGAAVDLDSTRAQIRPPLRWSSPMSRLVNVAVAYPKGIAETDIAGQFWTDSTSITAHGYYALPAISDLLTAWGNTTGNTAKAETRLFAKHVVENNKEPQARPEAVTFKSMRPEDPRAAATWALICGQDIGDALNLAHGYPGGVGVEEDFFIQGSEMSIRPLNDGYDLVEVTVNISPAPLVDVFT